MTSTRKETIVKLTQTIRKLGFLLGAGALLSAGFAMPALAELPAETRISREVYAQFVELVSGLPKAEGVKRITDKLQRRYEKLKETEAAHRAKIAECSRRKWNRRQQQTAGCTDSDSPKACQVKLMTRCTRGTRRHMQSAKARFLETVDKEIRIVRGKVEALVLESDPSSSGAPGGMIRLRPR
ncbi:MAG: hypothetical protein Kow006_30190 [Gammaproteobacteria bacterium]